jgi:FeS assembly SUF system protein
VSENSTPAAAERRHGAWTPEGEVPPPPPEAQQRPSEDTIVSLLKTVFDPEIPVDIYELGLIYAVEIGDDGKVKVEMTLTTPSCPSAQELPAQVEEAVRLVPGVTDVEVEVVWDPPWDQSRMSEDARLALDMF